MKLTISFKHLEHTPALDERIHQKSEKFYKYFNGQFDVDWTCYVDDKFHVAEIKLIGPSFNYHALAKTDDMYKAFDMVVGKIEAQIKKKKGKWKDHIHHKHDMAPKYMIQDKQIKAEDKYVYDSEDEFVA